MDLFVSSGNVFKGFSDKWLEGYISSVENLLAKEDPDYVPPMGRNGKQIKPTRMPWMIPVWKKGLQQAQEELNLRNQSNLNIVNTQ